MNKENNEVSRIMDFIKEYFTFEDIWLFIIIILLIIEKKSDRIFIVLLILILLEDIDKAFISLIEDKMKVFSKDLDFSDYIKF